MLLSKWVSLWGLGRQPPKSISWSARTCRKMIIIVWHGNIVHWIAINFVVPACIGGSHRYVWYEKRDREIEAGETKNRMSWVICATAIWSSRWLKSHSIWRSIDIEHPTQSNSSTEYTRLCARSRRKPVFWHFTFDKYHCHAIAQSAAASRSSFYHITHLPSFEWLCVHPPMVAESASSPFTCIFCIKKKKHTHTSPTIGSVSIRFRCSPKPRRMSHRALW